MPRRRRVTIEGGLYHVYNRFARAEDALVPGLRFMRIIAFIIDHAVVDKILRHLERRGVERERGPPDSAGLEAVC